MRTIEIDARKRAPKMIIIINERDGRPSISFETSLFETTFKLLDLCVIHLAEDVHS